MGHQVIKLKHEDITSDFDVDVVFNLASYGNMSYQQDRDEIFKANITNLYALLNGKWKKFINFSTSSVLLPTQTMYSATKAAGEQLVSFYKGINVRPSTIIGKGEQKEHLIPTLINSCLTGESMPFVPEPTHDFIDIEDVIEGTLKVLENGEEGMSYNISNNNKWSNQDVKYIVEFKTGRKANTYNVGTLRKYDTFDWRINNYDTMLLGWKPKKPLEQSIEEMI